MKRVLRTFMARILARSVRFKTKISDTFKITLIIAFTYFLHLQISPAISLDFIIPYSEIGSLLSCNYQKPVFFSQDCQQFTTSLTKMLSFALTQSVQPAVDHTDREARSSVVHGSNSHPDVESTSCYTEKALNH